MTLKEVVIRSYEDKERGVVEVEEKVYVRADAPYGIELGIDNGRMGWRSSQLSPTQAEDVARWLTEAAAQRRELSESSKGRRTPMGMGDTGSTPVSDTTPEVKDGA